MTGKQVRAQYTREYKLEAVRQVQAGQAIAVVAKVLGIPKASLGNWVRQAAKGNLDGAGDKPATVTAEQMELARLRAEVARLRMERDIAKKAAAYFALLRHEVAYIIVSPAHKVGDETGRSVGRSLPVHASLATASCEATGTTRRAFGPRHLPRGRGVICQHQGG